MVTKTFENEYFLVEKDDTGTTTITVLKDDYQFYGICMTNSKLITNSDGVIKDQFSQNALDLLNKSFKKEDIHDIKLQIRCRLLNVLMSMI